MGEAFEQTEEEASVMPAPSPAGEKPSFEAIIPVINGLRYGAKIQIPCLVDTIKESPDAAKLPLKRIVSNEKKTLAELETNGYTIVKNVLNDEEINNLLHCTSPSITSNPSKKRRRSGTQIWQGAVKSIDAHISFVAGQESVVAPLTTRSTGRYDLPLPASQPVWNEMYSKLESTGLLSLLRKYVPNGRIATQNVVLAKKGAVRQPIHSDHPRTGYCTALIPLVRQTKEVGGTRIFPGSHKKKMKKSTQKDFKEENGSGEDEELNEFVDCVSPLVEKGDCVLFDGLLMHCGLENNGESDRYFYYAAFCRGHDYNTDATAI